MTPEQRKRLEELRAKEAAEQAGAQTAAAAPSGARKAARAKKAEPYIDTSLSGSQFEREAMLDAGIDPDAPAPLPESVQLGPDGQMAPFGERGLETDIPFLPMSVGGGALGGALIANKASKLISSIPTKASRIKVAELKAAIRDKLKKGELVSRQDNAKLNNMQNAMKLDLRSVAHKRRAIGGGAAAGGIGGGAAYYYLPNIIKSNN